jgi:type IV pilus assembly protein PilX
VVALVVLVILTLLGTAAVKEAVLAHRMVGQFGGQAAALHAAENALRAGETLLQRELEGLEFGTEPGSGLYDVGLSGLGKAVDPTLTENYGTASPLYLSGGEADSPPAALFIERLTPVQSDGDLGLGHGRPARRLQFYRITARSEGSNGRRPVILRGTFLPRS